MKTPLLPGSLPILILQHPQEPGHELGTVELALQNLPSARKCVGLSWRSLTHALSKAELEPSGETQLKRWLVFYFGSGPKNLDPKAPRPPRDKILYLNRKGEILERAHELPQGLVFLDGTWAQAKTLWWRNPWLLKLQRTILLPSKPSLYGKLRKEPKPSCLSTVESIELALSSLGSPAPGLRSEMENYFNSLKRPKDS